MNGSKATATSLLALAALGCSTGQQAGTSGTPVTPAFEGGGFQALSLLGDSLFARPGPDAADIQLPLLDDAVENLAADEADVDRWIWVGRRQGYLQDYRRAISTYSRALERFPDNPRLLRHRGHRFISVRDFGAAVEDLARAGELIEGTPDRVEADGLPNARGIPTSTLHFNIWYHLGLAHYASGDLEAALRAYERCLAVSKNPDALVATTYWMVLTLKGLGRDEEARTILDPIDEHMDIIENDSYRQLALLFKGARTPEDVLPTGDGGLAGATTLYGVAKWYQFGDQADEAERTLGRLLSAEGQWSSFGYIAAEADVASARE